LNLNPQVVVYQLSYFAISQPVKLTLQQLLVVQLWDRLLDGRVVGSGTVKIFPQCGYTKIGRNIIEFIPPPVLWSRPFLAAPAPTLTPAPGSDSDSRGYKVMKKKNY